MDAEGLSVIMTVSRVAGGLLALAGGLMAVVGAIGVIRFPDVYTRLHAASITDTGGAILLLLGLALACGSLATAVKLLLVGLFILVATPTATHALANAAYSSRLWPWLGPFQASLEPGREERGAP